MEQKIQGHKIISKRSWKKISTDIYLALYYHFHCGLIFAQRAHKSLRNKKIILLFFFSYNFSYIFCVHDRSIILERDILIIEGYKKDYLVSVSR